MIKLDLKDKKILSELDMDARQPLAKIAKKVGLSREVVNYRIKQLEKKGIIEGYYAVLDLSKLGFLYCRIYLKYRKVTHEKEKEILEYCQKSDEVIWVTIGEGKWDFVLVILTKNLEGIDLFYEHLNMKFGHCFQNPYLSPPFQVYHFKHNFLYKKKDFKQAILGEKSKTPIKTDSLDYSIIKILSNDARISLLEIAKQLKTTPKVINYRIKKLIKEKIILAFRAQINTRLLGYDYYKVLLNLQNLTKANKDKLYSYLRYHPNVIYIIKPMGIYNVEFEIMVKNANELHEMLREFRLEFPDIIVDYETILNYAILINRYLPPNFKYTTDK